jgi:hypothetical protein
MLQHLSARFRQPASDQGREPRAALFLNRFTRTLTIMYATTGIDKIIGISSEDMKGRSFYYCVAEASLEEAVRVLESAKGNDSIAYLRFVFRDPRQDDQPMDETTDGEETTDAEMTDVDDVPHNDTPVSNPTTSNGNSNETNSNTTSPHSGTPAAIELEAVVSCTSDGLVVCLRLARPAVPTPLLQTVKPAIPTGIPYFAAPWGSNAIYSPAPPAPWGATPQWPGMPVAYGGPPVQSALISPPSGAAEPSNFMAAIQECGVFAWDLIGINGSLTDYAHGEPSGRAAPPDGPAVWDPEAKEEDAGAGSIGEQERHGTSSGRGTAVSASG